MNDTNSVYVYFDLDSITKLKNQCTKIRSGILYVHHKNTSKISITRHRQMITINDFKVTKIRSAKHGIFSIILIAMTISISIAINSHKTRFAINDKYGFNIDCPMNTSSTHVIEGYLTDMVQKTNQNAYFLIVVLALLWIYQSCQTYQLCRKYHDYDNYQNIKQSELSEVNKASLTRSNMFLLMILFFHIIIFVLSGQIIISSDVWMIECPNNQIPMIVDSNISYQNNCFSYQNSDKTIICIMASDYNQNSNISSFSSYLSNVQKKKITNTFQWNMSFYLAILVVADVIFAFCRVVREEEQTGIPKNNVRHNSYPDTLDDEMRDNNIANLRSNHDHLVEIELDETRRGFDPFSDDKKMLLIGSDLAEN